MSYVNVISRYSLNHIGVLTYHMLSRTLVATAFDTTACALSRILFELACDQDVQARLRTEIMESRAKHGEINYEQLESLAYLEAVCRETLRL